MRMRRPLAFVAVFLTGIIFVNTGLARATTEAIQEVFVTNGDDNPVPTKAVGSTQVDGTVDVGNFPETQEVSGSVYVLGQVTTRPDTDPRPFQKAFGSISEPTTGFYEVPEGKQLRLGTLSGQVTGRYGSAARLVLYASPPGTYHWQKDVHPRIVVPVTKVKASEWYQGAITVDAVFPEGTTLRPRGEYFDSGVKDWMGLDAGYDYEMSIFGTLENEPAPRRI